MDRDFVHERDGTYRCWCTDEDLRETSRLTIGSSVTIQHQPDLDRTYIESARKHRKLCDGRTGIVIAEHDSHGLCYEVRLQGDVVVTFDREELELA